MDREGAIKRLLVNGIKVDTLVSVIHLPEKGPGLQLWSVVDYLNTKHGFTWTRN